MPYVRQTEDIIDISDKRGEFPGMAKTNKVQLRCYIGPDERESLAISQDFTRTAWQLGNSEKILLRHYYRVTDRETAEAFWNLTPTEPRQLDLFPLL